MGGSCGSATVHSPREPSVAAPLFQRAGKGTDTTLADLVGYREAIISDRLRSKPEQTWDILTWAWNYCVRNVVGWPAIEIQRVPKREIYVLPWSAFPSSLK